MVKMLQRIMDKEGMDSSEAEALMRSIMGGEFSDAEIAGILVALKMKGESVEEISAFAKVMRENSVRIAPKVEGALVDTCGTGGDSLGTFNISTAAAFIACGAGIPIAKHGNKAVSGKSGSADVLEELGGRMLSPPQVEACIGEVGFGFMFAPFFHPAMKNVMPVRGALGVRTVFNILGPLTNPAGAQAQVLGVFEPSLLPKMAQVLDSLGVGHALVVHSGGMDELGLGESEVAELKNGNVESYSLDSAEFGFLPAKIPACSSASESAEIVRGVLEGKAGPARDVCVLNAAAAIYVGGGASGIGEGVGIAENSIDSGSALGKLEEFARFGRDG
ncbi:anthranilate phosphoribosyltransferase [Candidatus Micrarchaeota archaeon]|nr:anthranilate phosphoribosyltransferase [Candidatus Micrarchaeota archaeon]